MAVSDRPRCAGCGHQFRKPRGTRRTYCFTCHPSRPRPEPLSPVVVPIGGPAPDAPALVEATRAELAAAGRDATPEGLIVLTLAAQIAAGGGSAAGLTALVKEFHASKARALEGATEEADVLDGIFGTGS